MQSFLILCLILAIAAYCLWAFGSRETFLGKITFNPALLGDDLERYLAEREGRFSDLRDGVEKKIVWNDSKRKHKTGLAFVYIHGFSASRMEISPVPERVAEAFNANLFLTRLKGHGRTPQAMAAASADDWVDDVVEAVAFGARLGDKVIILSMSSGASIVTWLAANRPEWRDRIAGHVLISPNYKIADPLGFLLTWPFARQFVPLAMGKMRGRAPSSPSNRNIWTLPHATTSLMPMAKMVEQAAIAPVKHINTPALFIYSLKDQVVSPAKTEETIALWGGQTDKLIIQKSGHKTNHVIIGDTLSPETTELAVRHIITWVSEEF